MATKIKLPNGKIMDRPEGMTDQELVDLIDKAFPPMRKMGESAAEDDVLGVSTAGIEMPTEYGRSQAVRSFAQAPSFSFADEIESFFTGRPSSDIREEMKRYNEESGGAGTAAEMLGGAYIPFGRGSKLAQYGKAALGGLVYGTGKAEGDMGSRLAEGASTAVAAPLFMLGANIFTGVVSKPLKAAIDAYDRKMTKQSFDRMQKQLYKDLDMAGTIFSPQDTNRLATRVKNLVELDTDWNPKTHKIANSALQIIKNRDLTGMSWAELDKMRGRMWNEYNRALKKGYENERIYIRDMIQEVDDFVNKHPGTTPGIDAARKVYKQNQKVSALDSAWEQAKNEPNTAQAFTSAVNKMLTGENARFLSQREIDGMKSFLNQMKNKKFQKAIASLDPSSNSLMLAINQAAGYVNPKYAMAQYGASKLAKSATERDAMEGLEDLRAIFSEGTPFARTPYRGSPIPGISIPVGEKIKPDPEGIFNMIPLPIGP